jgi:penicillin-binding protein 2
MVTILVFVFLYSRMFFLQVVMGGYYRELATGNRLKREVVVPERGRIVDINGTPIAFDREVEGERVRYYPDGEVVGAVIGYLSEGEGVTGLEKEYQERLAGVLGEKLFELDARGEKMKELGGKEAVAADDLKLDLDVNLQRQVYGLLKERLKRNGESGVVIVARVSGEVLSLVSLPSFDPNLFEGGGLRGSAGGDYASVEKILGDEVKKPLFDRAIGGAFAPGSVFKVVTAMAGLTDKVIEVETLIEDTGEIKIDKYRYGNWYFDQYGRTEGMINLSRAIARSNDVYFYRLGEKLGVEKLVAFAKKMGVGEVTGIDLPGEVAGFMPDPLWRERTFGEPWFLGNTYHLSIGQGDLMMTPLQVNRVTAEIVSGLRCEPRLVQGKGKCSRVDMADSDRLAILAGMRQACMEGGTGFTFFDLKGRVYCKTGTAQQGGKEHLPHAWMSVVVPGKEGRVNEESIVVTVLLEEAGEGSSEAGPVARKVVDYLLGEYYGEDKSL